MTNKTTNYISKSPAETKQIGADLASGAKGGEVIYLYGDLGSGKTTFASGFINFFLPEKRVLSPTFIIVRHYKVYRHPIVYIHHVDLYRISKTTGIKDLGLSDFLKDPKSVFLIEWPEKIGNTLTNKRIDIKFNIKNNSERGIKICYR